MMQTLKRTLQEVLRQYREKPLDDLLKTRYDRLMSYGKFKEMSAR